MTKIEEIYQGLKQKKKQKAEIQKMFRDELNQNERYVEINEQIARLREEKKAIENETRAADPSSADQLEALKIDIASDQEMLADVSLNMYVKEETVEIIDEYDQAWYPEFRVNFKKL